MLKTIAICATLTLTTVTPATAQGVSQSGDAPAVTAAAGEVPQGVKDACLGDYEKHCKKHDPESTAAHDCMAHAFEKLSDPCVTAILDSPLVEQEQQRLAASARDSAEGPDAPKTTGTKRTAKAQHAAPPKLAAVKSKRYVAQRHNAPRRNVASHIRRGTGIASRYVARYTRFAFARVFR